MMLVILINKIYYYLNLRQNIHNIYSIELIVIFFIIKYIQLTQNYFKCNYSKYLKKIMVDIQFQSDSNRSIEL